MDVHSSCDDCTNDTLAESDRQKDVYGTTRTMEQTDPKKQATARVQSMDTKHTLTNNSTPLDDEHENPCERWPYSMAAQWLGSSFFNIFLP